MKDLLDTYWIERRETPTPRFMVINDPDDSESRIDYNMCDIIIVTTDGSEQLKFRGNIQYYDRIVPVSLDIRTMENRQRLHDIYKMLRMILFNRKHDFPNYQLIKMLGYQEMVNQEKNIWRGVFRVQLENNAIPAETLT